MKPLLFQGIEELPDYIIRWMYLATVLPEWAVPLGAFASMAFGSFLLIVVFLRAYRKVVFTKENFERGKRTIRRGSSFIINGQHRLLIIRDSYTLLQNQPVIAESSLDPDPDL